MCIKSCILILGIFLALCILFLDSHPRKGDGGYVVVGIGITIAVIVYFKLNF